jgi:hypothetical protein
MAQQKIKIGYIETAGSSSGQVLTSNGTALSWSTPSGGGSSGASWSALTSTNTALRTLISDRMQVANTKAYLANTNSFIKSQLANTNLRVNLINTNLTGTNTALRTLISDRMQVANAIAIGATKATWTALTGTNTAIRTLVDDRLQVANAAATYVLKNSAVFTGALTANGVSGVPGYYLRTSSSGIYWSPGGATWAALTGTNTALRTLISDRLQVANASAIYQTKAVERAALANTNLRINLINTNLTGTNTALRTLINNRLQVANAAATYAPLSNPSITGTITATGIVSGSELTSTLASGDEGGQINLAKPPNATTSGGVTIDAYQNKLRIFEQGGSARGVYIDLTTAAGGVGTNLLTGGGGSTTQYLQVANAVATYQTKSVERAALANTNSYIATKASLSGATFTGNVSFSSNIYPSIIVGNNGLLIEQKNAGSFLSLKNNGYEWKIYPSGPMEAGGALIGGSYGANKVDLSFAAILEGGNFGSQIKASNDRTTYYTWTFGGDNVLTLPTSSAISANGTTGTSGYYLRTGSGGVYWSPVSVSGATWAALTGTNTAIRTLVSDRYQVANVNTNFLKKSGTVPQTVDPNVSFSANVAIQGKLTVYGGVTTYSANNLVLGDNMIYLNSGNIVTNPDLGIAGNYNDGTYHHAGFFRDASDAGTWKVFENYSPEPDANTFINTAHASFKLAPFSARDARFTGVLSVTANTSVGNTTVGGFLKLDGTDIRATFAQNTYVKTTLANTNLRVDLINTNLTGTNTALRLLINNRYQVANVNTLLNAKATWAGLTGTNTALRTLISDRYQVANVNTLLAAKATWTGLTGTNTAIRTLVSDRLQVANATTLLAAKATWTGLTATNTALRTLISDRLQVANASSTYLTKNNPVITGTLTANASVGTAGYYLRTSGTGIYWSPVAGGGGSAANGFSGILVGANVVSADSTTDRLTLVAGSGITIAANPTTDTITFTATGGGGSFTGGTISGATTVTDTTASTSNLTGAFKVTGGVGVTGNIYTAGRVGYASNTTSGTSAAYTYYNATTGSLDTVFG